MFVRNCIDATSQCFGCICEILDFWWPKDAPNCLKKEIVRAMSKKERVDDEVKKDVETQTPEASENEDDTQIQASGNDDNDHLVSEERGGREEISSYPFSIQTTLVILLISVMLFLKFQ